MTKENKLNYCKGCKNRKLNMEVGLVCSLTNSIGEFENSCEKFISNVEVESNLPKFNFSRKRRNAFQKMSTFLF